MGSKRASRRAATPQNSNQYLGVNQIGMAGTSSPPAGSLSGGRRSVLPDRLRRHSATMDFWTIDECPDLRLDGGKNARDPFERMTPISVAKTHRITAGTASFRKVEHSSSLPAPKEPISVLTLFGPGTIAAVALRFLPPAHGTLRKAGAFSSRCIERLEESGDARQHKFAPRVSLAVVQAGQREEGHLRYVSAARFDLWVDGIYVACIKAARHQHRREDVVEAGPVLGQREIRLETRRERSPLALRGLWAKHFLHARHERSAALRYPPLNHPPERPHSAGIRMLPPNYQSVQSFLGIFGNPEADPPAH